MILVEFTPAGGSLYRLSTEDIALTYQWFGYITSIVSIKIQLPTRHGGYAEPSFSDIQISPELFEEIGSYPEMAAVRIIETDTNEVDGTEIFSGTAVLSSYDRSGIGYSLRRPELSTEIASGTVYNSTLTSVAGTICTALGLTLDATLARSSSPAVLHTTTSNQIAIDLLSSMCSSFCHGFEIVGTTLHLFDMLGTDEPFELTEFDVQPCSYRREPPYSLYRASDTETLAGSGANGDEEYSVTIYHTTSGNIQAALADIKTVMEQAIATIPFKAAQDKPRILDRVSLLDESLILPVTVSGIITSIIYNYDTLDVEVEVSGSVVV